MIRDEHLDLERFHRLQRMVLAEFRTGQAVDHEEAVEYLLANNRPKLPDVLQAAELEDRCVLSALAGVAGLDEMIELDRALVAAGCGYVPTSVDTHTRWHRFEEASKEVARSHDTGRSTLNGFPLVHHGVPGARRLVESVDAPLICRHSAEDARLLSEIAIAGGYTGFVGGATGAFTCYGDRPLAELIANWQYVDRLVGEYESRGVSVFRDQTRYVIGAGGFPPSLGIVLAVCNAVLGARQGVRHLAPAHCQQGSILQNVTAIRVENELIKEYLLKAGLEGVSVYRQLVSWNGAFPNDEASSYALLVHGAMVAGLAGCRILIGKSVHEAFGIPTLEANADSMRALRYGLDQVGWERMPDSSTEASEEYHFLRLECSQILDNIFEMGDGDVAIGLVRAFETGMMDVPYSPNPHIRGDVLAVKDEYGAIRMARFGALPLSKEVREYHERWLRSRSARTGEEDEFQMAVDDIMRGVLSPQVVAGSASQAVRS